MAMARRGMKPEWNRYETGYETGMKPVSKHRITHTICFFVVTAYKAMAAALDGNGARRYETGMKPNMKLVWSQYEPTPSPTLFVSLSSQPTKQWQLHWMAMARRIMKPVWNRYETRYETVIQPPHHLNYLFLCRQSLQSNSRCTGWQWRDAVWNRYETGYETGMKPL